MLYNYCVCAGQDILLLKQQNVELQAMIDKKCECLEVSMSVLKTIMMSVFVHTFVSREKSEKHSMYHLSLHFHLYHTHLLLAMPCPQATV